MLNLYCLKLLYTARKFNVRSNNNLDPNKGEVNGVSTS